MSTKREKERYLGLVNELLGVSLKVIERVVVGSTEVGNHRTGM